MGAGRQCDDRVTVVFEVKLFSTSSQGTRSLCYNKIQREQLHGRKIKHVHGKLK